MNKNLKISKKTLNETLQKWLSSEDLDYLKMGMATTARCPHCSLTRDTMAMFHEKVLSIMDYKRTCDSGKTRGVLTAIDSIVEFYRQEGTLSDGTHNALQLASLSMNTDVSAAALSALLLYGESISFRELGLWLRWGDKDIVDVLDIESGAFRAEHAQHLMQIAANAKGQKTHNYYAMALRILANADVHVLGQSYQTVVEELKKTPDSHRTPDIVCALYDIKMRSQDDRINHISTDKECFEEAMKYRDSAYALLLHIYRNLEAYGIYTDTGNLRYNDEDLATLMNLVDMGLQRSEFDVQWLAARVNHKLGLLPPERKRVTPADDKLFRLECIGGSAIVKVPKDAVYLKEPGASWAVTDKVRVVKLEGECAKDGFTAPFAPSIRPAFSAGLFPGEEMSISEVSVDNAELYFCIEEIR